MKKVAIVMGSDSDLPTMQPCMDRLDSFGIPYEVRIISAHRTPSAADEFATSAKDRGIGVIIAAAGKAAHLAGVLAAYTILPIIGVPIKTSMMGGLDSLLSMVQMPKGVPVGCMGVDGAENAAIFAAQILAVTDPELSTALGKFKQTMEHEVMAKDTKLQDSSN